MFNEIFVLLAPTATTAGGPRPDIARSALIASRNIASRHRPVDTLVPRFRAEHMSVTALRCDMTSCHLLFACRMPPRRSSSPPAFLPLFCDRVQSHFIVDPKHPLPPAHPTMPSLRCPVTPSLS